MWNIYMDRAAWAADKATVVGFAGTLAEAKAKADELGANHVAGGPRGLLYAKTGDGAARRWRKY